MSCRSGCPADRGSADAYYGRAPRPHFYANQTVGSKRYERAQMTEQQIEEYLAAYAAETERKDME